MLGIYAQLARGEALVADGVALPPAPPPWAIGHALIALAGPETAAGRNELVRALAWLLAPDVARPFPDIINYSQGNGPLCREQSDGTCRGTRWFGVTRIIDRIIDEQNVVVAKSAGNHGFGRGSTMTVPGDTYNGITVGNMHAYDWTACRPSAYRAQHKVYRTSSVAPAPGQGPRLLDLVAPGVRIRTTGVDPAYCRARCASVADAVCAFCPRLGRRTALAPGFWKTNSGSSPAAAVVGATAGQLMQQGLRDPRLVKAVLINSADAWSSAGATHPRTRGDGQGCREDGPARVHQPYHHGSHYDRSYGWGYLNAERASVERAHARLDAIRPSTSICYRAELDPWDKLTLVWNRHVGTCADCADHAWHRLNALELALYAADEPHALIDHDAGRGRYDNVTQVSNGRGGGAMPRARRAIVRVRALDPRFDGVATQRERFGLASPRPLSRLAECPTALH